jgi:hypothetical protein
MRNAPSARLFHGRAKGTLRIITGWGVPVVITYTDRETGLFHGLLLACELLSSSW